VRWWSQRSLAGLPKEDVQWETEAEELEPLRRRRLTTEIPRFIVVARAEHMRACGSDEQGEVDVESTRLRSGGEDMRRRQEVAACNRISVLGNDSSQAAARNAARMMVQHHKYGEASAMMVLILAMNCTTRNWMMPLRYKLPVWPPITQPSGTSSIEKTGGRRRGRKDFPANNQGEPNVLRVPDSLAHETETLRYERR